MSKKDQKNNENKPVYTRLETVPMDPRFPNTNVTKHCWLSYVEFHRCQKSRGVGDQTCAYFQNVFKTMCPNAWLEKWDEQREAGIFPVNFFMFMSKKSKEKEKEEAMSSFKLETAPFDPRYPNTNQTRYCYQSYLDYHRCRRIRGEKYEPCNYFQKCYKSLCPNAWVEKWDEQRENGTFPGRI